MEAYFRVRLFKTAKFSNGAYKQLELPFSFQSEQEKYPQSHLDVDPQIFVLEDLAGEEQQNF